MIDKCAKVDQQQNESQETTDRPGHAQQVSILFVPSFRVSVGKYETLDSNISPDAPLARRIAQHADTALREPGVSLANEIKSALENKNPSAALIAIRRDVEAGVFSLPLSAELLEALLAVDATALGIEDRRVLFEARLATADVLHRFDVAGPAAEQLLSEHSSGMDADEKAALEMAVAIGHFEAGRSEAGLLIIRRLLKSAADLSAESRGWAWRNLSLSLSKNDPEARRAARYSSDAFLQAGKKIEACQSLARLVSCLEDEDPGRALSTFDEILKISHEHELVDRAFRSATLHEYSQLLSKLGKHAEALARAREAAELARGLIGRESQRAASLSLAAYEARALQRFDEADLHEREASNLAEEIASPRFRLAARLSELFTSYDPQGCDDLERGADLRRYGHSGRCRDLAGYHRPIAER